MKILLVLSFLGAIAAGFALSDQVMQAFAEPPSHAAAPGPSQWFAKKMLQGVEPKPEVDPALHVERCARMVKESKVPADQASDAFKQCLEAE